MRSAGGSPSALSAQSRHMGDSAPLTKRTRENHSTWAEPHAQRLVFEVSAALFVFMKETLNPEP